MLRPLAAPLAATLLLVATTRAAGEEPPAGLHFSGEPIGSEYPLARGLAADAAELLGRDNSIRPPDAEADALRKGQLVRAFAEAVRTENSTDTDLRAQSHARRALILARFGAVNFAAEHANAALPHAAVRGEVMLARAWMLWHAGNLAGADREAARATGAPAWALAEWQAHRAKFAPALAKFSATKEPDDVYSADFLAYAELAAAAHAYYLADGLYFRAVNNLQQQVNAEKNFPPDNLQRARRGFRDLVRAILGDTAREPGAARLSALLVAIAREVCATPASRADWETYLTLVDKIRTTQPQFDFAYYDIHGDLARAEKEVGLDLAWREKLKPLLSDPRLRFASRVHQALTRLDAHDGAALLSEPLDATFTTEQLATLQAYGALVASEDAVLSQLYKALPAGTNSVPRSTEYVVAVAKLRFRLALLARDLDAAREQLAKLEQFPDTDPAVSLDAYRTRIAALERAPFLETYAQLLRFPPEDVPEERLERALAAVRPVEADLMSRPGTDYFTHTALSADDAALVQRVLHVRLLVATSTGNVFSAERALATLQRWCDPQQHPAFAPLPALVEAVADLPAPDERFTAEEQKIWVALKDGKAETGFPARLRQLVADAPDRFAPRILLPLAHWRLGQDDLAAAAIADTKKIIRVNQAIRAHLDQLAENNDPVRVVRNLVTRLAAAPDAERRAKAKSVVQDIDGMFRNLTRNFSPGQHLDPQQLPSDARRAYAYCVAGLVHARLAEDRLVRAVDLLIALDALREPAALALAQPAVESFPFQHDLPDPAAVTLWRDLLQAAPLSGDAGDALSARAKLVEKNSISIVLGTVAIGLRQSRWPACREFVASLRRTIGRNRAVALQLDALDQCVSACISLAHAPATPELDRRRQAHLNDKNRAENERRRMAVAWDRAPEAFKENWDRTADLRQWDQLAAEMAFHQQKIDAIDAEKAGLLAERDRAVQARLARFFHDLNALAGL